MTRFAFVSRQGSGTSMFVQCLTSHPKIECYGAVFWSGAYKGRIFIPPGREHMSYAEYRKASLARRFAHLFRRKQLINQFLTALFSTETDAEAVGFKVMYDQLERMPSIVEWIKEHDLKVIHLIRQNMLRTLTSREVARVRGFAHSTKQSGLYTVRFDPARVKALLDRTSRWIETYRQVLSTQEYLELTYESFVTCREEESRRIIEFLGVEPVMNLHTKLVKQNPYPLSQVIENYEEVVRALRGTPYEPFLEDEGL